MEENGLADVKILSEEPEILMPRRFGNGSKVLQSTSKHLRAIFRSPKLQQQLERSGKSKISTEKEATLTCKISLNEMIIFSQQFQKASKTFSQILKILKIVNLRDLRKSFRCLLELLWELKIFCASFAVQSQQWGTRDASGDLFQRTLKPERVFVLKKIAIERHWFQLFTLTWLTNLASRNFISKQCITAKIESIESLKLEPSTTPKATCGLHEYA